MREKDADHETEHPRHRTVSAPHEATLRQFFLDQIISEMHGNTPETRRALAKFNLKAGKSQNPYSTYPLKAYVAFFEEAALVLDRPFLGLELGQNFRLWEIGPVYPLLAAAPTLREALAVFLRFQASWQSHTTSTVHQEFGETRYGYAINDMAIWPRVQDAENSTAGLCALIRQLYSERWSPVEICFEHDISGREVPLKRYFRCPVRGNATANVIVIRDADLDRPMQAWVNSNAPARAIVEMHLIDLLRPPEDAFRPVPERLSQLVDQRLGRENVDLETLADILGIAPRTLRRQLSTFGTSFTEILNRERLRKAEMLLSTGSIKVSQLAAHLGYANQSAFSRAFREWTGETPLAALRRARHSIGKANTPDAEEKGIAP
ncbi:AraC family transcriptional regulator ligand-binding domain-containing protein [uncultured Hoeflea sp.]|uniref:AraC family transcriptional regulator n=1 Tax=uncultured Hoeflea sp. TaxID=538666 RepID=UPI0030D76E0C